MNLDEMIPERLKELHSTAPDSIGDILRFELLECSSEAGVFLLRCHLQPWMRNPAGTLHGGICATILDQAMGLIAYCLKPGPGFAPTIQMQVSYHRPIGMHQTVLARVTTVSVSKSLISLRCDLVAEDAPQKVCVSGSGTYFYKPASNSSGQ